MRAVLLCLVALVVVPCGDAAPAPNIQKQKLEALKKQLPAVLETWIQERHLGGSSSTFIPVLRRVRLVSESQAKVVVHLHSSDNTGKVSDRAVYMLTVFLSYYDGLWTTVRFQWNDPYRDINWSAETHFLMDAIDETAEK